MAPPVGSASPGERWPRQAVLAAMFGGLASAAVAALACWQLRAAQIDSFELSARAAIEETSKRFEAAAADARVLAAHLGSRASVESADFEALACTSDEARAAHWFERVDASDRASWRERASTRAGAALEIVDASGERVGPRTQLWPLTLRCERAAIELPLGLDFGSIAPPTDFSRAETIAGAAPIVAPIVEPARRDAGDGPIVIGALVASAQDASAAPLGVAAVVVTRDALALGTRDAAPGAPLDVSLHPPGALAAERDTFEARAPLAEHLPEWTLAVRPARGGASFAWLMLPAAVLVGGLGLSALLATRLRSLEMRSRSLSRVNAELYTEIAERTSVEARLRETQRALATLVANLPGVAYRCANDRDWRMEFISESCAALTGHPARDYLDGVVQYGRDVVHSDDREYVWNAVQQAVERRKPYQLVYRIVTSAGQQKWVWEQGRGVFSRADELLALEGLISDITERKLAEDGLKREMRFVDAIVDSLPGNFYVFDESGRFVRWNTNVETVTGYSPLELAAMNPAEFFEGEDRRRVEAAVRQVFEEGRTVVDARLVTRKGEKIPFHFTGVLFSHEGTRYLVGVGIDVSERERALEEQARLRAQLLHTAKLESLGVMASGVAHDFNNMLTVVLANAGLAQSALDPTSEEHAFLQQALNASQNASEITRQLLSLARGDSSAVGVVNLNDVVKGLEKLLRSSIKKRVRLEYALAEDLPTLHADAVQLRQIVLNLALNAGEACQERGGAVRISTGVRSFEAADLVEPAFRGTKRAGRHVYLEVRDDGGGMDDATLARLGEPFFTTRVAGRGLGLAAVLGVLRAHGGWLEVDSTLGEGSTVRACIPTP